MWQVYSNFVSSNIKSLWYNNTSMQLIVQYIGGGKYTYEGINIITWNELKNSPSKGRFIAEHVKPKPFSKTILNG